MAVNDRDHRREHDDTSGDEEKSDASGVHVANFNSEWFRVLVLRKIKDAELVHAFRESRSDA